MKWKHAATTCLTAVGEHSDFKDAKNTTTTGAQITTTTPAPLRL